MNETSQEKYTFICKIQKVHKLKQAISALCDPEFNPKGVGRIDVDDKGLKITVWNVESRVLGSLRLQSLEGSNRGGDFGYRECFNPRMVNLSHVFRVLAIVDDDVDNDDTVIIYHVLESDELCFLFGNNAPEEFSAKLLDLNAVVRQFPVITAPCVAIIPSEYLRQMIPFMFDEGKSQNVSVKMTENEVSITVGDKEWLYEGDEINAIKGWKMDEEFSRCFQWPHSELMIYSSYLSKMFLLGCLDDPPDSIMFRFSITQTWALTFIRQHDSSTEQSSAKLNLIQKPIYSFSFHVCPIITLKQALRFLTKPSFCKPPGLGMIQVSNSCFQIVVRNTETDVFGLVQLLATGLINYRFKKALKGNMVDVRNMARNLLRSADTDDFIGVGQVDGSNEISFKTACAGAFAAELLEMDGEFQEWPYNISIAYEAIISTKHLKEMVPRLIGKKRPQIVSLEIMDGFVSIAIGEKSWDSSFCEQLPELKHRLWFRWPHPEMLKQAADLADWFGICILTDPPNSIMLRVQLQNIGYLAYITKVSSTNPTSKVRKVQY